MTSLRPILPEDLAAIVRWGNDPDVIRFTDEDSPKSIAETPAWYRKIMTSRNSKVLAIVADDGNFIGTIELDNIAWRSREAELRIRIGEKQYWNRGYGTDAICKMVDYAFSVLRLKRIYLRVYSFNLRAVRCYEKCGFRKEGKIHRTIGADKNRREILLMTLTSEDAARNGVWSGQDHFKRSRAQDAG